MSCRVSVIMPIYNAERFLHEALDSVLSQTFKDFECILVNDASTDGSVRIIQAFHDPRIVLLENDRNRGVTYSLNRALEIAQGKYIVRMDADDIMHTNRIAKQLEAMESDPEIAVLSAKIRFINADGEETGFWNHDQSATSAAEIRNLMPATNCIAHPSVMMRREMILKFRYSYKQKGAEDWDLWLRLLNAGYRIEKLDEVLLSYRVHHSSVSAKDKEREVLERRLMRVRSVFLFEELRRFRLSAFLVRIVYAQLRTIARHVLSNLIQPLIVKLYRLLTYNPFKVFAQRRALKSALEEWSGNKVFFFSYLHEGGAEQVHADVLAALNDSDALVFITGFSRNQFFKSRFESHAVVVEVPHLINHPFYAEDCLSTISERINSVSNATVFGSNNSAFFDVIEKLNPDVRCIYLIHAFKFQQNGNLQHRKWLRFYDGMYRYVFVSKASLEEFQKLCLSQSIPRSKWNKMTFISNAVSCFSRPEGHDGLRVLFVGRKSDEKRVELFYEIARRCKLENDTLQFSVVGFEHNTPSVHHYGVVIDPQVLSDIYSEHDVLLVTSSREGFPMVIMEAMAHGLLVGASPVGDIPNRLEGSPAFITSHVEADVVVDELVQFVLTLAHDSESLSLERLNSYNFSLEHFAMKKFVHDYKLLFEEK